MAPLSARVYLGAYYRLSDPENERLLPLVAEFKKWPIIVSRLLGANKITEAKRVHVPANTGERYHSADFATFSSRQRLSRIPGRMRDGRSPMNLSPQTTKRPLKRQRKAL